MRDDYRRPDPATAIQVTAKWTCEPGEATRLDDLEYWWQRVGTDAHSIEEGLLRFEVYEVIGEDAPGYAPNLRNPFTSPPHLPGIVRVNREGGNVIFVILLGIGLVAVGIGATLGGGWATVGAVVLLALGLKVLFMAVTFMFLGRRFRAMHRRSGDPETIGRHGRWSCGPGSESMKARMEEWHRMAHAGPGIDDGIADPGDIAPE